MLKYELENANNTCNIYFDSINKRRNIFFKRVVEMALKVYIV